MQQNEDAIKEEYRKVQKRRDEKLQKEKLNVYRNANGTVVEVFKRRKDEYFRGVIEFNRINQAMRFYMVLLCI